MASFNVDFAFGKRRERLVAAAFAEKIWPGSIIADLPAYSHLDFAVIQQSEDDRWQTVALLEVKTRRVSSTRYDTTIVASRKTAVAQSVKEGLKLPVGCLVLFADGKLASFDLTQPPDSETTLLAKERSGRPVRHNEYSHARFTYHNELVEQINAQIGED
jgi:hypothetical protein